MRKLCIVVGFLLIGTNLQAQESIVTGKVVSVADGDTFTLLVEGNIQQKIRLHGIDCPEKRQDFGQVAKIFTRDKVFGKTITIKPTDTDRYGRTVAIVYLPDGKILNELLLKNGLAWHYMRYDKNQAWDKLEKSARLNKIGLWVQPDPVAPWEFRRSKQNSYYSSK